MKRSISGGLIVLALVAGLGQWTVAYGRGLSAAAIETSLKKTSGKATLEKYFPCDRFEGTGYQRVASGAREWVSVAVKMLAYSDGCYTEGIQDALGRAMKKAPQRVLPVVGTQSTLGPEYVCLPFISDEQPVPDQLRKLRQSKQAITAVQSGKVTEQKRLCLDFIAQVEKRLRGQ